MRKIDLVGQRFGKWIVKEAASMNKNGQTIFKCICDCGTTRMVISQSLRAGISKSCGCDGSRAHIGKISRTHGLSHTQFWNIYNAIKARCGNRRSHKYPNYGGRGIKNTWQSFTDFKHDMFESYQEHVKLHGERNTSIHRTDNDGNYCKENCRWATYSEQARNKTTSRYITFGGRRLQLVEWAEKLGTTSQNLLGRLNRYGWSLQEALTIPPKKRP